MLYLNGKYTARAGHSPRDAAALERHVTRRRVLRERLARRAERRRRQKSEDEAELLKQELHRQYEILTLHRVACGRAA